MLFSVAIIACIEFLFLPSILNFTWLPVFINELYFSGTVNETLSWSTFLNVVSNVVGLTYAPILTVVP
jgi:hypothetical protein